MVIVFFINVIHADGLPYFHSGPARVHTLRGKYRQFVLRVTADNKDEIVSANVQISADRTLDLTVEMVIPLENNLLPGCLTRCK